MLRAKISGRAGPAPTLSDVARRAGVSPMTVSRVINRGGPVRETTRERVQAAIAALGYAPNPAARTLAGGGQVRIALVYRNPSSAFLGEVLVGSLAEAARGDVQLLLEQWDGGPEAAAARLAAIGIDGVVLPAPLCDDPAIVAPLVALGIPLVALAAGRPVAGACAVMIDDAGAAADMTRHLIARGHRRIGFVAGPASVAASSERRDGHLRALAEAGVAADEALLAAGDFTYRSGLAAAERLLSLAAPPTAIFASNDDMAAAAIAVAHRHHLDVPGRLSVAGFDDTALATTISPELTTVRQPVNAMAQAAIAILAAAPAAAGRGQAARACSRTASSRANRSRRRPARRAHGRGHAAPLGAAGPPASPTLRC